MGENHSLSSHIRAARNWLFKAEQSFDNRNELQGKLHLMLAQAEMQYAQEKKPEPWHLKWKVQALAVGVAGLLVSAGLGFAYFGQTALNSQNAKPAELAAPVVVSPNKSAETMAAQQTTVVAAEPVLPLTAESAVQVTRQTSDSAKPVQNTSTTVTRKTTATASESVRPTVAAMPKTEEVEHLVRVAGKSLRTP